MTKEFIQTEALSYFTIERASDSIFWVDSEARIYFVNEAACKTLGYTRDELLKLSVYDIDADFPKENWPNQWSKVKELKSFIHLSHHIRNDGTIFPVEISANYIEYEGREYSCAFVRDITKRIEAEKEVTDSDKRFRDIFIAVNDGILMVDPEFGQITDVNDSAVQMLGYTRKEMIGMSLQKLHPGELPL